MTHRKRSGIRKGLWITFGSLAVVVILLHFYLDTIIKIKANRILATLPEYTGHIDGVSVSLFRGAFDLESVEIKHRTGDARLTLNHFRVHFRWLPLFHRKIVATVTLDHPDFLMMTPTVTQAPEKAEQKAVQANRAAEEKTGQSLPDLIKQAIPFKIEGLYIVDGTFHVRQPGENLAVFKEKKTSDKQKTKPALDIQITQLYLTATNVTNSAELSNNNLTESVEARALLFDKAPMDLKMNWNPLAQEPAFQLSADLKKFDLTLLNPFLDWQWGVDVKKGALTFFMQANASNGAFKGYVKPLLEDLQMLDLKRNKNPMKIIKEAAAEVINKVLRSSETQAVATEVPFQGQFDHPNAGIWTAVIQVLRNGFVQALRPRFDHNYKPNPKLPLAPPST